MNFFRLSTLAPVLWLFVCPLIVGVARGSGILVLRPNEVLLLILILICGGAFLWNAVKGKLVFPTLFLTDYAIAGLCIFGTCLPLLLGIGRGTNLNSDDYLYVIVFLKYAILYGLFRFLLMNEGERKLALLSILFSEAIVALLALLQAKQLFGVNDFLATYYDAPFEGSLGPDSLRASSTIASSFGLADSMIISLSLAIALLAAQTFIKPWQKALLAMVSLLFAITVLAAGSFTGLIGCAVAVFCVGALTGRLKLLVSFALPAGVVGCGLLWPTIAARLDGFSGYRSLPQSWLGRLDNLERFFWPEVFTGWNWLLGVRPAARVAAPEGWRDWVYIESGYTWLFWTGGLPLALVFFCLLWCVYHDLISSRSVPMNRLNPIAVASLASTAMIAVVMLFDPHLTVRGCADLFFPLLAMALVAPTRPEQLPSTSLQFLQTFNVAYHKA